MADTDKAQTVARIRGALAQVPVGSDSERKFLEALLVYWGTLSDLIQLQEHGGQKEGTPPTRSVTPFEAEPRAHSLSKASAT